MYSSKQPTRRSKRVDAYVQEGGAWTRSALQTTAVGLNRTAGHPGAGIIWPAKPARGRDDLKLAGFTVLPPAESNVISLPAIVPTWFPISVDTHRERLYPVRSAAG